MNFEKATEPTLEQVLAKLTPEERGEVDYYVFTFNSNVVEEDFSLAHERLPETNQEIVTQLKKLFTVTESSEKKEIGKTIAKLLVTWREGVA